MSWRRGRKRRGQQRLGGGINEAATTAKWDEVDTDRKNEEKKNEEKNKKNEKWKNEQKKWENEQKKKNEEKKKQEWWDEETEGGGGVDAGVKTEGWKDDDEKVEE